MRKPAICYLAACLLFSLHVSSQSLYRVPLGEKVQQSSVILEGKVISQKSFWNPQHTMIFTSNKIDVYKLFKGNIPGTTVEVLTQGGTVGNSIIGTNDLLGLSKNQVGLFFCFPNSVNLRFPDNRNLLLDVYSSSQGFYKYDIFRHSASAPFEKYNDIERELYGAVRDLTGEDYRIINSRFSLPKVNSNRGQAPSISSFSPATVYAGAIRNNANNILTINGSGFGTASGSASVLFANADDGGASNITVGYSDPLIISWSATQIKLHVPSGAGTGNLKVQDAGGIQATAGSGLSVLFSVLDASYTLGPTTYTKETNLMNTNGSGGYTVVYSTSASGGGININTDPAKATFQRALTTWKEIAGYNVIEGGTTASQVISDDGLNTIMYDNTNTGVPVLGSGTLAVCYFFANVCGSPTAAIQRTGFDIIIRNSGVSSGSATFTNGPCPPMASDFNQVDLESVLTHELGHSLGLGHVIFAPQGGSLPNINTGEIMHYAISNGVRRISPDYSALAGATYQIQPKGDTYGSCGLFASEMTALSITSELKDDCPVSFPTTALASGTSVGFDLVHATSNNFGDPSYLQVKCTGTGTPVTNNAYYALKTSSTGGTLSISVSGYSTTPATITSCGAPYGFATTGVRLSLYQVNSCPAGQSFPAPFSCTTFSGNGALASITGLAANTNYLVYVDGIENTKASFNLTFSGTVVLPLVIFDFRGQTFGDYNEIYWSAGQLVNVNKLLVQKSADGVAFDNFGEFSSIKDITTGKLKDGSPFTKTYYRLAIVNDNGHTDYSKTILLVKSGHVNISMFPNPATDIIQVTLSSNENGYRINIYNNMGQLVRTNSVNPGNLNALIQVKDLPRGIYQVTIFNNNGYVESHKLILK